jgi:hypothetical protein
MNNQAASAHQETVTAALLGKASTSARCCICGVTCLHYCLPSPSLFLFPTTQQPSTFAMLGAIRVQDQPLYLESNSLPNRLP